MATSNRPGTRFTLEQYVPRRFGRIRSLPFGFDPFQYLKVIDYGDCFIDYGYPNQAPDQIEKHALEIIETEQ